MRGILEIPIVYISGVDSRCLLRSAAAPVGDKCPGVPQPGSGQPFRAIPVLTMKYCAYSLGVPLPSLIESRQLSANRPAVHPPIAKLPLVTLYVTERCNSRCVTRDYWRHRRDDMDLAAVTNLLPSHAR